MSLVYNAHVVYDSLYTYDGQMLIAIGRVENVGDTHNSNDSVILLSLSFGSFGKAAGADNTQASHSATDALAGISGSLSN